MNTAIEITFADYSREDLERYADKLVEQERQFVANLGVDVSGAEKRPDCLQVTTRRAAEAYERLAFAQKNTTPLKWERNPLIDGRSGDDLMQRLWDVSGELKRRDKGEAQVRTMIKQ